MSKLEKEIKEKNKLISKLDLNKDQDVRQMFLV